MSHKIHMNGIHGTSGGFTLVELLVAMGVGLFVVNVAVYSFYFNQKLIHRIEVIGSKNDVAQNAVLWTLNKQYLGTSYPTGVQYRQIGAASVTYLGGDRYYQLQVQDWSTTAGPSPPYTIGTLIIPVTGD